MEYIIILLSILLCLLIIYIIILNKKIKSKIEDAKKQSVDDFFSLILQAGYNKRVDDFKIYNNYVKENGIVFVGDSLTENYNVYEYFKGYNVYNRGIGGDTTNGLIARLKESVYDLKPSIVILLIGINDFELVGNSCEISIVNNIKAIIHKIKENCPNTKIILESLYPISKENNPKIDLASVGRKDNKTIDIINEQLSKIDSVIYVDMNKKLKDDNGNFKLDFTVEGLHANANGYIIITKILKEIIDNINKD